MIIEDGEHISQIRPTYSLPLSAVFFISILLKHNIYLTQSCYNKKMTSKHIKEVSISSSSVNPVKNDKQIILMVANLLNQI